MLAKLTRTAPWLTCAGALMLLIGLAWDAALHRIDPQLAAREDVFSLANPGHLLLVGGIALCVASAALFLIQHARMAHGRMLARIAIYSAAVMLIAMGGASFALAASGDTQRHDEDRAMSGGGQQPGNIEVHGADAPITDADRAAADTFAADTRAGAARFADFAVAQREGYVQTTPFRFGDSGPAHFNNPAYMRDGKYVDPEHPEGLVYLKRRDGAMVLLGVVYKAPTGVGSRPGGAVAPWHSHDNPDREMVHVWLVDNPDGPFAKHLSRTVIRELMK